YLNIYNNYFKAPWMPDRTEANPNELNQDDARYGFRCCHLKNIWTAPLPPETSYMAVGFYVAKYVNKKSDMDLAAKGLGAKEWNNSLKTKLSLLPKKLFRIR